MKANVKIAALRYIEITQKTENLIAERADD
jgi:hypothetical protein